MYDLPGYVWVLVLAGAAGIPALTAAGLYRGGIATGLGRRVSIAVAATAGAGWAGWIAASALFAGAGAYQQDGETVNPWLGVALLAALVLALVATRLPVLSRIVAEPGAAAWLVLPQAFRVVGGVFLIVMALDELPPVFALPAGLGDIAVGIAAPFVAWRLARGTGQRGAVWFNVMGIADLVVAVGIGTLAGLGPLRLLAVTPSTEALTMLPLALIPTTAVPLALALHVLALRRLRTAASMPARLDGRRSAPATG